MTYTYDRAPETVDGLRLHLNENTAGCSPAVLDRLRHLDAATLSTYPDYSDVVARCERFFGLGADRFVLTNGMDEGILAACVALLQRDEGPPPEALIPMPAFEQYAVSASACGARVVAVSPRGDLDLALKGVLAAITRATRLVFLASPANPTGLVVPADALVTIARALPPQGALFLDEAYVEFAEGSALALLDSMPSLVIGRTFSKAYGLAALRLGALLAAPSLIDRMRRVVPPYSLNACAIAALPAALDDEAFTRGYLAEVVESRRLLYDACERFGWRYWPSAANFVLIRVGERAGALVDALGARGIHVRDRSRQPGCEGCIRVTAGVVAHTRACIDAMEAFQCEAR